jgi:dihydrofolate reductase
LPADLAYFKRITLGKPVVMGRRTCDSLPKPLPGRRNLVFSRNPSFAREGFETVADTAALLRLAAGAEELVVIGGAELYRLLLPLTRRAYVTVVEGTFTGDTWFPEWPLSGWHEITAEDRPPDAANTHPMRFSVWERLDKHPSAG